MCDEANSIKKNGKSANIKLEITRKKRVQEEDTKANCGEGFVDGWVEGIGIESVQQEREVVGADEEIKEIVRVN